MYRPGLMDRLLFLLATRKVRLNMKFTQYRSKFIEVDISQEHVAMPSNRCPTFKVSWVILLSLTPTQEAEDLLPLE
jgi:hypothetical protein